MKTSNTERPKISLFSNLVVGLRGGFDNRQDFIFVKANDSGQNCKLHDVDTTFAAFRRATNDWWRLSLAANCCWLRPAF